MVLCSMLIALWILVPLYLLDASSSDDDTFSSFLGFNNLAEMPYKLSDMTAVSIKKYEVVPDAEANSFMQIVPEDRIYLFGGCTSDLTCTVQKSLPDSPRSCSCQSITNKCIYYKPIENQWRSCASAPVARYRHAAAEQKGKVYMVGGRQLDGSIVKQIDIYDMRTNTWDPTGIVWKDAVYDAVAYGWGINIMIAGGFSISRAPVNTVTRVNTIARTVVMDMPNMLHARGALQVQQMGNKFYVWGGFDQTPGKAATGACTTPSHHHEVYDADRHEWTQLADAPYGRASPATGSNGRNLYFSIAGETYETGDKSCTRVVPVGNVGMYNSTSGGWTVVDRLPGDRFRYTGASYFNGTFRGFYLFGGLSRYDATCGCPAGQSTECGDGCYRLSNVTTLYVPVSVYVNHRKQDRCGTKTQHIKVQNPHAHTPTPPPIHTLHSSHTHPSLIPHTPSHPFPSLLPLCTPQSDPEPRSNRWRRHRRDRRGCGCRPGAVPRPVTLRLQIHVRARLRQQ